MPEALAEPAAAEGVCASAGADTDATRPVDMAMMAPDRPTVASCPVKASLISERGVTGFRGARWRDGARSDNVSLSWRLRGELSGSGGSHTRPGLRDAAVRLHPKDGPTDDRPFR